MRKLKQLKNKMQRPLNLAPLFASVKTLNGIGPRLGVLFEYLCGPAVIDILYHLPTSLIDRRHAPKCRDILNHSVVTLTIQIQEHYPPSHRSKPYRIRASDDTGIVDLIFFHAKGDYLLKQMPIDSWRIISGKAEYFNGIPQIAHPDYILPLDQKTEALLLEPVYPLSAGLTNKTVTKAVQGALTKIPNHLSEWLDPSLLKREEWVDFKTALTECHLIKDEKSLDPDHPHKRRLAYDEILANQLTMAMVRQYEHILDGRVFAKKSDLLTKAIESLPYHLTKAQERTLDEILSDMSQDKRMFRLLQGDVGSGKTIVAFLSMLRAIENNAQATLMVPTEILARQHEKNLTVFANKLGIKIVTLTGRDKGKARSAVLEHIQSGEAQIIIGTHALFQKDVTFKDLGLVIVDEQHRFGVHQRLELADKGRNADVLVMTATPIPRTLTMTVYGDMEVSRLDEKPSHRQSIDTRLAALDRIHEVVDGIKRKIKDGAQVYWVCPLVEESEKLDLKAATERFEELKTIFKNEVALVHGRMKAHEKDDVMSRFKNNEIKLLISTTVIEVGVDVPNASIMVIEHAERFGLAQLHQLRGRVGRGSAQSTCILLYAPNTTEIAKKRLQTIRNTEDGFIIAEEDLKLRGAGEVLGTKQSGLPQFRFFNFEAHADLLMIARDDAKLIMAKDKELKSDRGKALITLLHLFKKEQAMTYLRG